MRVSIVVGNSTSRVVGISQSILKMLRFGVCYFDFAKYRRQGAIKRDWECRTFLIDENGIFLTGLAPHVFRFLKEKFPTADITFVDNRIRPKGFIQYHDNIDEPVMYADQKGALDACMNSHGRGVVVLPTGVGKTRTFKELIKSMGQRFLVVPPSINLKQQTFEYLHESFGDDNVQFYKKGKAAKNITVMNYHAIKGEDPSFFLNFDGILYDEFHHAANNTIRENEKTHLSNMFYRFAFTATNFRNNDDNILLESVMSETLYEMNLIQAISKKYIVPVQSFFFELDNSSIKGRKASKRKIRGQKNPNQFQLDYEDFIVNNDERNDLAVEIAKKMESMGIQTLILVGQVSHGMSIQEKIEGSAFANSTTQKPEKNMEMVKEFNAGRIRTLIGTSVIGEGVDTKPCGAIINLSGGQAESELLQKVGRVIRNFAGKQVGFYFDFMDNGPKSLKKHSRTRLKIIKTHYGKSPIIKTAF